MQLIKLLIGLGTLFVPAPLYAENPAEILSVQIGQRFEPIVERFQATKARYEKEHPGSFYQGFVADVEDRTINGGIPLGATFGSPLAVKLEHGRYSLTFPPGKFTSFSFSDGGDLENFRLNPQLEYSNAAESRRIAEALNKSFEAAGWRRDKGANNEGRWRAGWTKADIYLKRTGCKDTGDEEKCELVEISLERVAKLSAKIVRCGEIARPTRTVGTKEDPGSHTGSVQVMHELESPVFKPGCPLVKAALGVQFGLLVLVNSEDGSAMSWDLVTRVTHPPFSNGVTVDEWNSPMNIGVERYTGWVFEDEKELVPGKWAFEIVLGTETLASQVFMVERAVE